MAEPSVTANVNVLDSNYQVFAKGTLGFGIDPNDNAATGVLSLAGSSIVIDGANLTGVGRVFIEQSGDQIAMGANILLGGQYADTPLSLLFTSWGDGNDVLGYFFIGQQEPGVPPYIITSS